MELTGAAGEEGENRAQDMSCHRYIYIMFFFFFYTNGFLVIGYAVVPCHPMAHLVGWDLDLIWMSGRVGE